MNKKILIVLIVILVVLFISGCIGQKKSKINNNEQTMKKTYDTNSIVHTAPDPSNRFIRIRVLGDNGKWHLTGLKSSRYYAGPYYSPDDVLATIQELKPDVLERFISGPQNLIVPLEYFDKSVGRWVKWNDQRGGAGGFPPGTVGSFLVQTMQNGAQDAYFTPRLDSEFYNSKGAVEFFAMVQNLYKNMEDLGIPTSRRYLSLDNWGSINKQEVKNNILSTLYAQGWQGIGVTSLLNYHAGTNTEDPANSATWSVFNVDPANNWGPNKKVLQSLHAESNLKLVLLYIDFPEPMGSFIKLAPDEEARILEQIAKLQTPNSNNPHKTGFTFVYPIAQGANAFADDWDAKARITEPNGEYKGASIYQFIRDRLMPMYFSNTSNEVKKELKQEASQKDWFKEGAVYETHPYYYGENGKISDVTAVVPSIADLGVKTIYLMPIFESINTQKPCHDIYNIKDYNKIEPRFGNEADLKKLVDAVHANGMRIILDMVTRLTPEGSVTYNNTEWMMNMPLSELKNLAKEKGWKLSYAFQDGDSLVYSGGLGCSPSLFLNCQLVGKIKGANEEVVFFTWPIPKGYAPDNANTERIEYITNAAKHYVEVYGIDGWRIDTPYRNWNPEVFPEDHSVIQLFRNVTSEIREIKPDAFFMPEHPHIYPNNEPVMDEVTDASYSQYFQKKLDSGIKTSAELVKILSDETVWHNKTRMRYWETHDYERIASKKPKQTKAYAVLLSTIPGIPFIQAGQEIGAKNTFCSGSAAKAAVDWNNGDYELREYYKKVLSIRNSSNALKYGDIKNAWKSGDNVYAYSRTYENETVIVVINFQGKTTTSILNSPFKAGTVLKDELSSETFNVENPSDFKISVPAYGSRILTIIGR